MTSTSKRRTWLGLGLRFGALGLGLGLGSGLGLVEEACPATDHAQHPRRRIAPQQAERLLAQEDLG